MGGGEGVASVKRKAQAQILDMLQTRQSQLNPSQRNKEKEIGEKKLTMTQGGTRIRNLANPRTGKGPAML